MNVPLRAEDIDGETLKATAQVLDGALMMLRLAERVTAASGGAGGPWPALRSALGPGRDECQSWLAVVRDLCESASRGWAGLTPPAGGDDA